MVNLSDFDIKKNILNLNKSRQRDIYIRPDGSKTQPLPSDPMARMYYEAKGFKLQGAEEKEEVKTCPFCDFKPQSPLALRTHLNTHIKQDSNKED